jgi:hypothetical protein
LGRLAADQKAPRTRGFRASIRREFRDWCGSWLPPEATKPVIDRHMLFVLYTPQVDEDKTFFRHLKSIQELKEVAEQEMVLIEHIAL